MTFSSTLKRLAVAIPLWLIHQTALSESVVVPNRTLPAAVQAAVFSLPDRPVPADFAKIRDFIEPLAPVGGQPSESENQALGAAIRSILSSADRSNVHPLEQFLIDHPTSPWKPAIQTNLAIAHYASGWYSKALTESEEAWNAAKDFTDNDARRIADRALGEFLKLNARLGRQDVLERTFAEIKDRVISPAIGTAVTSSYESMAAMQTHPDFCFRCGPMALRQILQLTSPDGDWRKFIEETRSPRTGFSLPEVLTMSEQLGLNYQIARRSPGAPVIVPSVVHWKLDHYAALVRRDGAYTIAQDATFNSEVVLSDAALDAEASGWFLVPEGPLPEGWQAAQPNEAAAVYGKGNTSGTDKDAASCSLTPHAGPSCSSCPGMPQYSINLMQVGLTVTDTPVGYAPPVGPAIEFTVRFHEEMAPLGLYSDGLPFGSTQIVHNWYSYLDVSALSTQVDARLLSRDGDWRTFRSFNTETNQYAPEYNSSAILKMISANPRIYELQHSDGSVDTYGAPPVSSIGANNMVISLTKVRDAHGNEVLLHYDGAGRLTALTDPFGLITTITYGPNVNSQPDYRVASVTDPFARTATFQYLQTVGNGETPLSRITDTIGLVSDLVWNASKSHPSNSTGGGPGQISLPDIPLISAITTPYGTTTFTRTISGLNRRLVATDPQGDSEVVEYKDSAAGIPTTATDPWGANVSWMHYRNTFHWTKKMWADFPGDYTKAINYHWQHGNPSTLTGNTLESMKMPFENRVWFTHAGQTSYAFPGTRGQPSSTARLLDNGTVQRTQTDYSTNGNVIREVDPVGRETTYIYAANGIDLLETRRITGNGTYARLSAATYNAEHSPLTTTDMAGQITSYTWNARGQLTSITDPLGYVTSLSYNADGYLTSVDGPLPGVHDTISLTYDVYGRPITWTDVDGYTLSYQYDLMDRLTRVTYPDTTYEEYTYNRLDRATFRDRQARVTTWSYNALRQLVAQTDPLNRTLHYEWCRCGSLSVLYDAMGRPTKWKRDIQGRVIAKIYADGSQYTYDYETAVSRLTRRTDAKGQFTDYQWTIDDQIAQISYPNAEIATPTCTYTYDPVFNRMTSAIAGPEPYFYTYHPITNSPSPGAGRLAKRDGRYPDETLTYSYDARGMLAQRTISGLAETWTYDAAGRVTTNGTPAGPFIHTYDGATSRLATRTYPNGIFSTYTYLGHSGSHRLQQIRHTKAAEVLAQFDYTYLTAGNIQTWTQQLSPGSLSSVQSFEYDAADQLTKARNQDSEGDDTTTQLTYDPAGNRTTLRVATTIASYSYNALNVLMSTSNSDDAATSYLWDAENRLSRIDRGSHSQQLQYDAHGLVKAIQSNDGQGASNSRIEYDNSRIQRITDQGAGNSRFFPGSQSIEICGDGTCGYFVKDHLGTSRLRDNADYSTFSATLFGQPSSPNSELRLGFTGHLELPNTEIILAPYRAYLPRFGRWLSRDPIEEAGGLNQFTYADNNPVRLVDPLGLTSKDCNCESDQHSISNCYTVESYLGLGLTASICWGPCGKSVYIGGGYGVALGVSLSPTVGLGSSEGLTVRGAGNLSGPGGFSAVGTMSNGGNSISAGPSIGPSLGASLSVGWTFKWR